MPDRSPIERMIRVIIIRMKTIIPATAVNVGWARVVADRIWTDNGVPVIYYIDVPASVYINVNRIATDIGVIAVAGVVIISRSVLCVVICCTVINILGYDMISSQLALIRI